ncbi:MAG: hypothetical protein HY843_02845 [Bdellovibrio sp.]|nr:hypothetical protein [Bdellovibrio sp.]
MKIFIIFLTNLFFLCNVYAEDISFTFDYMPSRFETRELTAGSRALGELCTSWAVMPDGTVCNSAFLNQNTKSFFLGRFYIGNGYSALSTANAVLLKPITKDTLKKVFENNSVITMESQIDLVFVTPYFSIEFAPYRIQYFSEIHNPNFPIIALHASLEKRVKLSGNLKLSRFTPALSQFTLGLELRLLDRKYIHNSFSFFKAIASPDAGLLPVNNQRAVFLDPSIGWASRKWPWKTRASIAARNIGKVWYSNSLYPEYTDIDIGVGVEPPVEIGQLGVGIEFVNLIYAQDFISRMRFGGSYKLGMMEIMSGVNANSLVTGLEFGVNIFQAGIVYEFIRNDLRGLGPENKISTEFSFKL